MYNEEIELNIRKLLYRNKVRCRSIHLEDDRVILGIEGTKFDYPNLVKTLRNLGLRYINSSYGRWVFSIR